MSSAEFGFCTLLLVLLITLAHLLGYAFTRLHQPRVIGEILAGALLGPAILGRFVPAISTSLGISDLPATVSKNAIILGFLYHFGMLLLMFASGAEIKGLFSRADRREVFWLGLVGTGSPFLIALLLAPLIPVTLLIGTANQPLSLFLVVAIALAVTSIPVISKILLDLKILNTRFGRLILAVAVVEDIVLWCVLALATAIAKEDSLPNLSIAVHLGYTVIFFGAGLLVMPGVLKWLTVARWNPLPRSSPTGYVVIILLGYCAVAALFDLSLVFAAFLAGYACVAKMGHLTKAIKTIGNVAGGVFIPIYFAIVGYTLDLTQSFSFKMLVVALIAASVIKLISVGAGARLAGFNWNDSLNLSMAMNARGGPGIVLASVAFEAHIINSTFYTTLVLVAVLTSLLAGTWLDFVLRKGWPLLSGQPIVLHPSKSLDSTAP